MSDTNSWIPLIKQEFMWGKHFRIPIKPIIHRVSLWNWAPDAALHRDAAFPGEQRGRLHVNWWSLFKFQKGALFPFSPPVPSQLILKYVYMLGCFDTSHYSLDTFWLCITNSLKLWENKMCQINLIITSNDRRFYCPIIYTDICSQCYYVAIMSNSLANRDAIFVNKS